MRRDNSFDQIEMLKTNTLLIRLHSANGKIKYLEENNNKEEAIKVEAKVNKTNKEIIQSFNENFDFCKVYFFNTSSAKELRDGAFNKVKLYNTANEEIEDKSFLEQGYIIANFGVSYGDELIYEKEGIKRAIGGTHSSPALVLLDKDYIQLRKPFPFRVLTANNLNHKTDAVKQLNLNLKNYYKKYQKKKKKEY